MPNLEKAYQQGELNAIAIALDYENIDEITQFTDSLDLTMPVLLGTVYRSRLQSQCLPNLLCY